MLPHTKISILLSFAAPSFFLGYDFKAALVIFIIIIAAIVTLNCIFYDIMYTKLIFDFFDMYIYMIPSSRLTAVKWYYTDTCTFFSVTSLKNKSLFASSLAGSNCKSEVVLCTHKKLSSLEIRLKNKSSEV